MRKVDPLGWAKALTELSLPERHIAQWAEAWADLMEAEMAKGRLLEEVVEEAYRQAVVGGNFGSAFCRMHVLILTEEWEFGAELGAWLCIIDASVQQQDTLLVSIVRP